MTHQVNVDSVVVTPVGPSDGGDWDDVVHSSDDASLSHDRGWNELVEEGVWRARQASVIARLEGRAVAVVPLHVRERRFGPLTRRILCSNAWGAGGPAVIRDLSAPERLAVLRACAASVHAVAQRSRADKLLVQLPVLCPRVICGIPVVDPMAPLGLVDASTRSSVIRLRGRSADDIWRGMQGRARTAIRKAEHMGVTIRAADPQTVVEDYYALHWETYRRTGARPHPGRYFETILRSPWSTVFFAERSGGIVAGLNVGTYADMAFYWTGASRSEGLASEANSLLQWHALQWLLAEGYAAYELGELPQLGVAPHAPTKLEGLARFKSSFGGEPLPYRRGSFVYATFRERSVHLVRFFRVLARSR